MDLVAQLEAEARAHGVRPWLAIKERLAERAIRMMAERPGPAVLQGGAALHFAYGSPRLSADVDYVGAEVGASLAARGPALAEDAGRYLGRPAAWSLVRTGLLVRGKIALELAPHRRLVLPIEAYEVPARLPPGRADLGAVEVPQEIAADKIVATASRLAHRGTLKTTDIYDLWYLTQALRTEPPSPDLVAAKARDYGEAPRGLDLAAAVRALPLEELRGVLEAVLPANELPGLQLAAMTEAVAALLEAYRVHL